MAQTLSDMTAVALAVTDGMLHELALAWEVFGSQRPTERTPGTGSRSAGRTPYGPGGSGWSPTGGSTGSWAPTP